MKRSGQPYPAWLWPNLLGLDAPAVAVAWQWLFAKAFGANLPPVFHAILALGVWCIYLADRLFDAIRTPGSARTTDRLMFTQRHFAALCSVALAAGAVNAFLVLRHVPRPLMMAGAATACLLAIYYALRIKGGVSALPRELLCGMIFGLGCVIAPHAFLQRGEGSGFIPAAILLGLLCSANCSLISMWEKEEDAAGNDRSMATHPSPVIDHIASAITALIIVAAAMAFAGPWRIHVSVAASAAALRLMLGFGDRLSRRSLRVLADAALLSPLLFASV